MPESPSERRLIENELIIRNKNINGKEALKKYLAPMGEATKLPLAFHCECSDLSCKKFVKLTIEEYEKLHTRDDRFCVYPGHQTLKVEKIVIKAKHYLVVEKESVPA